MKTGDESAVSFGRCVDRRRASSYDALPMNTRPYHLSKISMNSFDLLGYSVAGEESVVLAPELDVCFDIGKCPREALVPNHVLLTHGHADHSVGLLYYFAQRDFQGIAGGKALV